MRHGKCNGKTIYEHYEWTFTSCESQFLNRTHNSHLSRSRNRRNCGQLMIQTQNEKEEKEEMISARLPPCSSTRFRHQHKREIITFSIQLRTKSMAGCTRLMKTHAAARQSVVADEDAIAATSRGAPRQQRVLKKVMNLNI